MPTQNLAIMFTDIKGFTARVSGGKRQDLKDLLSTHERLLAPVITYYEGTIVKTIGDSFLARFNSPTDAVLCGVAIQEVLRQHNAFAGDHERIEVRVAINSGDVEVIDGDVLGEAVNLASRLEGVAEAGEVYFTEAVYLAMNRREAPSTEIGERTFSGIPYPVKVFKVVRDPDSELARRVAAGIRLTDRGPVFKGLHDSRPARSRRWRVWAVTAVAVAVPAGVWLYRQVGPELEVRQETSSRTEDASGTGRTAAPENDSLQTKVPEGSARTQVPGVPGSSSPTTSPVSKNAAGATAATAPGTSTSKAASPAQPPAASTDVVGEGRRRLESLARSQGAAAALDWLRRRLDQDPELEPLRDELPVLDARATGEQIIQESLRGSKMIDAAVRTLARYPKSAAAALELAHTLEGNVVPAYYPVALYDEAIKRGANPHDPHILEFCFGLMPHHWPGWLDAVHDFLQRNYDSEALEWARRAFDQDESGVSLSNAWRILNRHNDPRVTDPYYVALYRAIEGYSSTEEADHDLALFRQVTDRNRQQHVLAVYHWVFNPDKSVSGFGYSHSDLARRNLDALEELWGRK